MPKVDARKSIRHQQSFDDPFMATGWAKDIPALLRSSKSKFSRTISNFQNQVENDNPGAAAGDLMMP